MTDNELLRQMAADAFKALDSSIALNKAYMALAEELQKKVVDLSYKATYAERCTEAVRQTLEARIKDLETALARSEERRVGKECRL